MQLVKIIIPKNLLTILHYISVKYSFLNVIKYLQIKIHLFRFKYLKNISNSLKKFKELIQIFGMYLNTLNCTSR